QFRIPDRLTPTMFPARIDEWVEEGHLARFIKDYLKEISEVFKQILLIAHQLKVFKLGTISLDGSKIKANASKHKSLSWEYANKIEQQIKDEIKKLPELAALADKQDKGTELNIPADLKLREARLDGCRPVMESSYMQKSITRNCSVCWLFLSKISCFCSKKWISYR
ncbi:MAG TPA: hypothetical protein DF296_14435, partial [Candidatus Margulisbacteria bacterium]|nr:hypothetical protein [Candidatus Margulisiibacteriota bacterium]